MNAKTAGHVGIQKLKQFLMVNIKKGGLKGERVRPQSIRPLIKFPRGISDQAISYEHSTESEGVRPDPGLKLGEMDIASSKQQAIEETVPHNDIEEASSSKQQASSFKRQAR